ncbi:MAG: hypothetical protein L6R37_001714 [Teloschistes peruensis]|nr:MAG: hypothetical protein L6R37_001714 [Teloschistes peruensis]
MQTFTVTYSPSFATPTATASTTTSAPTADPSSLNIQSCPGLNGTNVDLPDGQAFAVVCGTNYGGPVDVGLYEGSFGKCVQDCGISNNGFSAPRCRGVTYLPYTTGGQVNCFWKNAAALDEFTADPNAVSAVLVTLPLLSVTIAVPTVFPTPFPTPTA